jgi:O-antigen/teichoic acid export membrane protein
MMVALYTSRVVLKTLGITDYGIYNVVGGIVSMLAFLNGSMANGIQRFLNFEIGSNNKTKLNIVFSTSIIIQLALIVLIVLLAETIGLWFLNNKMIIPVDRINSANWAYQLSILVFIVSIYQVPYTAIIIAYEKMNIYAYISIIDVFLKLGIVFMLDFFYYDKLILYSILILGVCIIDCSIYILYCSRNFNEIRFRFRFKKTIFRSMLSFSGWNIFGTTAHLMKSQGINILLNLFFGPAINAARAVAHQVFATLNSFTSNIMMAAKPQMIKSYAQNDIAYLISLLYRVSKFSFFLLIFLSLPVLIEIDRILLIWLGDNVPQYTSLFTRLIILTALVEVFASPITTVVHATGKMKKFQTICSSIILLIIPVSYLFLKSGFSPETPMVVSLVICILVHGVRIYLLRQLIPFSGRDYISEVILPALKVSILASICPLLLYFNMESNLYRLIYMFFICTVSTGLIIYFVGLKNNERIMINMKIKTIYHRIGKHGQ